MLPSSRKAACGLWATSQRCPSGSEKYPEYPPQKTFSAAFDEPTTGLDPITADAINDLILEQVRSLGAAAVSITHDMPSARKIADEIAMLFEGKIIWRGPASDIDHSGNEYVDQFVHGRASGPIQPAM